MEFSRVDKMSSRIFTEILADKHYKRLPQLNEYSYAIYKNGVSVEQNQHGTFERTINRSQIPPPGEERHDMVDNQDQVTYQSKDGIVVRISKYIPLSSQGFTLFIYFILVLMFVFLLLTFINHLYPFLPKVVSVSYRQSANTSLRYRIMIPVILFILSSYAVVFAFTFSYYNFWIFSSWCGNYKSFLNFRCCSHKCYWSHYKCRWYINSKSRQTKSRSHDQHSRSYYDICQ